MSKSGCKRYGQAISLFFFCIQWNAICRGVLDGPWLQPNWLDSGFLGGLVATAVAALPGAVKSMLN